MAVTIPPTYGKTDEGRIVVRHIARADGVRCGGQVVLRWNEQREQCEPYCTACDQTISARDVYVEDDACPHCGLYSRPDLGGKWARNPVYNVCAACVPEVSKTRPVEYWIRQVMARECIAKEKGSRMRRTVRARLCGRKAGGIQRTPDRFPQADVPTHSDGRHSECL